MLESVVGALVWLIANVVYVDMRRRGTHGFARLCAFWMGLPATVLWMITVPEASIARVRPPPDDDEALLAEIRRDRSLRSGTPESEPEARPDDA